MTTFYVLDYGGQDYPNLIPLSASNDPPAVVLDSVDGFSTADTTPDLLFTGTDPNSDDITYQLQIDGTNYFGSGVSLIFSDDFDDNSIDGVVWNNFGSTEVVETSQQIEITTLSGTTDYNSLYATADYPFTGAAITVEVVDAGNMALTTRSTILAAEIDSNNKIYIQAGDGDLGVVHVVGGVASFPATITYNSTTMRWWRLREDTGTTYWEYSPDGVAWTELYSVANPIDPTAVFPYLQAGQYVAEASSSTSIFDNFNMSALATDIQAISDTDAGFTNLDDGGDTDPFTSGDQVSYTVQSGLPAGTYYWRVRGTDPTGSATYGAWSAIQSFIITASGVVFEKTKISGTFTTVTSHKVKVSGTFTEVTDYKVKSGGSFINLV